MRGLARAMRLGLAACLACALALSFMQAPAHAVTDMLSGMWWTGEPPNGGVKPQTVPDGGLWVSSDSAGAQAVSALRFVLADGEDSPRLTLTAHSATPARGWTIGVCPAAPATWSPTGGSPGPMADAPKPDCSGGREYDAPAIQDASGATVVRLAFPDSLIGPGRTVNVVLFPKSDSVTAAAPSGAPAPSPTFDVSFDRVDAASVATVGGDSGSGSGGASASSGAGASVVAPSTEAAPSGAAPSAADLGGAPFATSPPPASAAAGGSAAGAAGGGAGPGVMPPEGAVAASRPRVPTGRERVLLAVALLGLLAWEFRGSLLGAGARRVSLYDLPPSAT